MKHVTTATIENVSDTAFWVAHYRGVETKRPDSLFRDPLAAVLAGDRGRRIAEAMPQPFITSWVVAIRTRIIDDFIRAAVEGGVDTVLNLGAGLDTRPYRMGLPRDLHWIEADYAHVIDYKEGLLPHEVPRFKLSRVRADLANPVERQSLLTDANAQAGKMLVLTEGVVPYLPNEDAAALADGLRVLSHAAFWIVDYLSPDLMKERAKIMAGKMKNAPLRFNPADWFGFFAQHGWQSAEVRFLGEESDRLGRQMELPLRMKLLMTAASILTSREARDRRRKSAGYVLLEPR